MSKSVITISREFGSGGRSVGRLAADRLGYRFYDRELITKVAEESGFSEDFVAEEEEYAHHKSALLHALHMSSGSDCFGGLSLYNQLQIAQTRVILRLAEEGGCVIVGRCADYILRSRADCLHVFIHADIPFRAKRIVEQYGERDDKPEKRLRDKDEKRRIYYKACTDRSWGDCRNYHISLDSGLIGIERCADIIADLARTT